MTSSEHLEAPKTGARIGALVLWLVFFFGFGVGGWFLVLEPLAVATGNWWQARDYIETKAEVVPKEGKDADGSFTWYAARYEGGGQSRETGRLSILEDNNIDERFNATVVTRMQQAHAERRPITVWVSPRKSEVALITRDLPVDSLWPNVLAGSMLAVFALAGLLGVVGTIINPRWYRRQHDAIIIWVISGFWCAISLLFFMLVAGEAERELGAMIGIGLFLLVGLVMLYASANASWVASEEKVAEMSKSWKASPPVRTRKTKRNEKNYSADNIKRGGMGGRGDGFDKN